MLGHHLPDQRLDLLAPGRVAGERREPEPLGGDHVRRLGERVGVAIRPDHRRALAGEQRGDRPAVAPAVAPSAAARHDRDLAGEAEHGVCP